MRPPSEAPDVAVPDASNAENWRKGWATSALCQSMRDRYSAEGDSGL